MEEKELLKYNKDYYAVMSNEIIMSKQEMTLQCARLIRFVIANIVLFDEDLKTYTCKISELADFLGVSRSNMYRDIDLITDQLMSSFVFLKNKANPNKWDKFHWVSRATSDGKGKLTIRLSDEIKPYVMALQNRYTQYQLRNILELSSVYTIRLYEIIKSEDNRLSTDELEFPVSQLRELLNCEHKYSAFKDFKKRAIESAINEINKKTDIQVEVEYIKQPGKRSVSSIRFSVSFNKDKGNINSPYTKLAKKEKQDPAN